jgi:hypothetical protein
MTYRLSVLIFCALAAGAQTVDVTQHYEAITPEQRLAWFAKSSFGLVALAGGLVSAGLDTWQNTPSEYGPHWDGFGKRYGIRVTNNALSSGMEAGVGALWGEDPRYFRKPEAPLGGRVKHVVHSTFFTHDRNGRERLAYARFIAVPATAFISNGWRPESEDDPGDALNRIGTAFANRMAGNAFSEFWPDVRTRLFHHRNKSSEELLEGAIPTPPR